MGVYEKRLKESVSEEGFKRLFYSPCRNCGKMIWSIDEEIDVEAGKIKALFLCNCGAKFKRTVYSRESKGGYKCIQGIVQDVTIKGVNHRVISSVRGTFLVTDKGIRVKRTKEQERVWNEEKSKN